MRVLSIRGLELVRGSAHQAYRVSLPQLDMDRGDVVAVIGPSGCGKSTLLEALGLILKPLSLDAYHLLDQDLTASICSERLSDETCLAQWRSQCYGFVPQTGGLLPFLTVQQNVELPAQIQGQSTDQGWFEHTAGRLGLHGLGGRYPRELSVGQRQRVSFLRALAHRPVLLLADEPTAALDPEHAAELFKVMLQVVRETQVAVLVVTHEWGLAQELGLRTLSAQHVRSGHMAFVPTTDGHQGAPA
jgi:putative ABC transport system ATP-binding protein